MKTPTLLVLVALATNIVSFGSVPPVSPTNKLSPFQKAEVEILVPASAEDTNPKDAIGFSVLGQENYRRSPKRFGAPATPRGLASLFPARDMRRITVLRYIPNWGGQTRVLIYLTYREFGRILNS